MKGAKVIFQDVHVSGHACQEEIKLIYSLVKPKYAIPVHGEYRHLTAQKHVAEELGYSEGEYLYPGIRKCSGDLMRQSAAGDRNRTHRSHSCRWSWCR